MFKHSYKQARKRLEAPRTIPRYIPIETTSGSPQTDATTWEILDLTTRGYYPAPTSFGSQRDAAEYVRDNLTTLQKD